MKSKQNKHLKLLSFSAHFTFDIDLPISAPNTTYKILEVLTSISVLSMNLKYCEIFMASFTTPFNLNSKPRVQGLDKKVYIVLHVEADFVFRLNALAISQSTCLTEFSIGITLEITK